MSGYRTCRDDESVRAAVPNEAGNTAASLRDRKKKSLQCRVLLPRGASSGGAGASLAGPGGLPHHPSQFFLAVSKSVWQKKNAAARASRQSRTGHLPRYINLPICPSFLIFSSSFLLHVDNTSENHFYSICPTSLFPKEASDPTLVDDHKSSPPSSEYSFFVPRSVRKDGGDGARAPVSV